MNMYPEFVNDFCIMLGSRMVPCMNTQIHPEVPVIVGEHLYGNYFEVAFETGALWVVSQDGITPIEIEIYDDWAHGQSVFEPSHVMTLDTWEEFLSMYNNHTNGGKS